MWLSLLLEMVLTIIALVFALIVYTLHMIKVKLIQYKYSPAWMVQLLATKEDQALLRAVLLSSRAARNHRNRQFPDPLLTNAIRSGSSKKFIGRRHKNGMSMTVLCRRQKRHTPLWYPDEENFEQLFAQRNQSQMQPWNHPIEQ